jgi:uncharacterized protein (TIGR02246 family)
MLVSLGQRARRAAKRQRKVTVMEIEQVLRAYEKALNASDADAVLSLYGEAPVFMPQHAPAMVGRAAVRKAYEQVFATIRLAVRFEIAEVEVQGDTGWARTSSAGQTTTLANGQLVAEGNNELFVLRREGGEWRIHRYLFATNQPPRA